MTFTQKIKAFIRRYLPQLSIMALTFMFALVYFWNSIFVVIKSGEAGVYYWKFFGGTSTDVVYDEGFQFIWPWDTFTIYNIRVQEKKQNIFVLTKEGMRIELTISIRYQPEKDLVSVLHKEVGPDYLEKVVVPEVESVLRETAGHFTADELYTTKHMIPKQIINDAVEQVVRNYVTVQDVIITEIKLPASVQKVIEEKIEQKHIAEAYVFRIEREKQEKERKLIEAEGIQKYNELISKSLDDKILKWQGIQATENISKSPNSKVVLIGNGPNGLPVVMSLGDTPK
jgi:regulator of protease activity HflC (stomatin/prohibitin superfamily)